MIELRIIELDDWLKFWYQTMLLSLVENKRSFTELSEISWYWTMHKSGDLIWWASNLAKNKEICMSNFLKFEAFKTLI